MPKQQERPQLKFNFINPNTQEDTVAFLAKLLPEIIYHNQFESGATTSTQQKQRQKSCEMER